MIPFYFRSFTAIDLGDRTFCTATILWQYDEDSDTYSSRYNNYSGKTIDEVNFITYEYFNSVLGGQSIDDVSLWRSQTGYAESMGYFNASADLRYDFSPAFLDGYFYSKYYFVLNGFFCRYQKCCDCQCS